MSARAEALAAPPRPRIQRLVAGLGLGVVAAGALVLGADRWTQGALFAIGGLLGVTLYHAAFGFTSAYRNAIMHRDVSGVVAQIAMLALAMLLFAPILANGQVLGRGVVGAVAPVGAQVAVGSFLFGLGMQLGGGCGSGTLFTVGGGSARMVVTLLAFIAGAFWGSLDLGFWALAPRWRAVSLGVELGWPLAIALQLGLLAAVWLGLRRWAGSAPQRPLWPVLPNARQLLGGGWPLLFGAAMLALLNVATLAIAGHPWTITWAFTLWGAKAAAALGWDPATSAFWSGGFPGRALGRGILDDTTSIMDIGIILGAFVAAGLAGKFAPGFRIPIRSLVAAAVGGLLMGYGARLAYGCNIGAFFSGVASTSLHAWLWIVCALAGTWLGIRLRPLFGLDNAPGPA